MRQNLTYYKMFRKLRVYFKNKKELDAEVNRLKHQTGLMHEHIMKQNDEISQLKRKLELSEKMWDVANQSKKY
jgi:predicted RNase H-like nuclease (RuvC/YqgF family)